MIRELSNINPNKGNNKLYDDLVQLDETSDVQLTEKKEDEKKLELFTE